MKSFKSFFYFYIDSSIHVSLAVVFLTLFTFVQFQIRIDYSILLLNFCGSIMGYNFVKYNTILNSKFSSLSSKLLVIKLFSVFVLFVMVLVAFFISWRAVLFYILLGLITFFYVMPFGKKSLREISYLKILVIAFVWASVTFLIPLEKEIFEISTLYSYWWLHFLERFIWIIFLMIPFEIRDYKQDMGHISTLATSLGVFPLKLLSVVVLAILFILKFIFTSGCLLWVSAFIYLSLLVVILLSKTVQKAFYSSFWVELLPVFWFLCLLLCSKLNFP